MKAIGLLFVISVIVEALIEYFEPAFDLIEDDRIKKAAKQGTAIVLAVIFSFQLKAGLIAILVEPFGTTVNAVFDRIVSGIFCSRGANYLSDIIRLIYSAGSKCRADADGDFWDLLGQLAGDDDDEEGDEDGASDES